MISTWLKLQTGWGPALFNIGVFIWLGPLMGGLAVICAWVGLRMAGIGTPAAIRAMNRALHAHGYVDDSTMLGRLGKRVPVIDSLVNGLNLERHLAIADIPQTAAAYLGRSIGVSLGVLGVGVFLDGLGFVVQGAWFVSPVLPLLLAVVLFVLRIQRVRGAAARKGACLDRCIRAIMPVMAAAMSVPGHTTSGAMRSLSSAVDHPDLGDLLLDDHWRRTLPDIPARASDRVIYAAIGSAYNSRLFSKLANILSNVDASGVNAGSAISQGTRVAFEEEIREINTIAAKAPMRSMLVMAGLVMLLMSLILVPMIGSFSAL